MGKSRYSVFTLPGGEKFRVRRDFGEEIHLVKGVAKERERFVAHQEQWEDVKSAAISLAREKLGHSQSGTVDLVSPHHIVKVTFRKQYVIQQELVAEAQREFAKVQLEGELSKARKDYDPALVESVKDLILESDFDKDFNRLFNTHVTFTATSELHQFLQQKVPRRLKKVQNLIRDALNVKAVAPQVTVIEIDKAEWDDPKLNAIKRFKRTTIDKTHEIVDGKMRPVPKKKVSRRDSKG